MKILYFSINKKHKKFFEKLSSRCCRGDIIDSKKIFKISLKALGERPNLSFPIELRVKDFIAKYGFERFEDAIKRVYRVIAKFYYIRYRSVINSSYSHLVVWNSSLFRQNIASIIAKELNIEVISLEGGLLPNRFVMDKRGVNFLNSVPRDREFFKNYKNSKPLPNSLIPRVAKDKRKFEIKKDIKLPKEFIFVPFQVDYDTQILIHSPWIRDMKHLFFIIEEIANSLKINFILKEHPSSKKSYPLLHKRAKKNSYITFANSHNTQELIEKSKAVITINSTVGIESLLFYKRVVVLGDAFYSIDGVTKKAKDIKSLIQILEDIDKFKVNRELISNFLKYLYYEYLIESDLSNIEKIKRVFTT
jgi:capsular polysaccharide export protein